MKLGTLHTEINYLLAILSFAPSAKGDGATLPSCASRNGSIDASISLLEALIITHHTQKSVSKSTLPVANKYLFANFNCLQAERVTR